MLDTCLVRPNVAEAHYKGIGSLRSGKSFELSADLKLWLEEQLLKCAGLPITITLKPQSSTFSVSMPPKGPLKARRLTD